LLFCKIIFYILSFLFTYSYGVKSISKDEITIPKALKKAGYATGMLGKWHLGEKSPHLPNDKGFDFFYGSFYSNNIKPYEIYRNKKMEIEAPAKICKNIKERCKNH